MTTMIEATRRRDAIRAAVDRDGYVSLSSLSEEYGVSPVTIHRDLQQLETEGALERIRGGARSVGMVPRIWTEFEARASLNAAEKSEIAARAMAEIPDGATIFLDSSTTALAMMPLLEREPARRLTVVTNSPVLGAQFSAPLIDVIVLPGELRQPLRAVTGRWTVEFIEQLVFSVAFVSAAGVTPERGLMTTQRELVEVTKAAFERAERRIALIDSSKFGVSAMLSMAPSDVVDLIITDSSLPPEAVAEYQRAGLAVVRAGDG